MTKLCGKCHEANQALGEAAVKREQVQHLGRSRMFGDRMHLGWISGNCRIWASIEHNSSCSGVCSEVSLIKPEDAKAVEVRECVHQCNALQSDVQHKKDRPLQTIAMCPHHSNGLEDCHFSLIHLIAMTGCKNQFVPQMFSAASNCVRKIKQQSLFSVVWCL